MNRKKQLKKGKMLSVIRKNERKTEKMRQNSHLLKNN